MKARTRLNPALARYKALQQQRTRVCLHEALDRFEHGPLTQLPDGTRLTHRNLAAEAGVAKDTAFSRYRKGDDSAGAFRFPEIVERYRKLRARRAPEPRRNDKDRKIEELRELLEARDEELLALKRVLNRLDADNLTLRQTNQRLDEENATLRRGAIVKMPRRRPR